MCEQDITATQVQIAGGKMRPVDPCIAPLVQALNDAGIATRASCCGHGKQPGNIMLMDGRELFIAADFETARSVERAFPPIQPTGGETSAEHVEIMFDIEEAERSSNSMGQPPRQLHDYQPHPKHNYFCDVCGYGPSEPLMHTQK